MEIEYAADVGASNQARIAKDAISRLMQRVILSTNALKFTAQHHGSFAALDPSQHKENSAAFSPRLKSNVHDRSRLRDPPP
jgi:hypothetical protein